MMIRLCAIIATGASLRCVPHQYTTSWSYAIDHEPCIVLVRRRRFHCLPYLPLLLCWFLIRRLFLDRLDRGPRHVPIRSA